MPCLKRPSAARHVLSLAVLGCLLIGSGAHVHAQGQRGMRQGAERQRLVEPVAPGITHEQAVGLVRRQIGGQVLSSSPVQRGGASGYEVRVLIDGKRVRNVFVDERGRIRSRD